MKPMELHHARLGDNASRMAWRTDSQAKGGGKRAVPFREILGIVSNVMEAS